MSKTTIKKGSTVNVKTKTGATYSYKFITLAQIHDWLDDNGLSYEATIKRVDDREYMFITKIDKDGNKSEPMQGSRVPAFGSNDTTKLTELMQDYGSVLSMARRYSLMMVYGLAPADDDDNPPTPPKPTYTKPTTASSSDAEKSRVDFDEIREKIKDMRGVELEIYKEKILKQNLTYKQKDAIKNIFEKRRTEIMAQNMGFKPKEG